MPALAAQLRRTVSIVDAVVVDAREEFDERAGPTTTYTLSDVDTLLGATVDEGIELTLFGGTLPDGSHISNSETPRLFVGTRYLLAVKGGSWVFSPISSSFLFRIETNDSGTDVLVSQDGRAVVGATQLGVDHSKTPVIGAPSGDNLCRFDAPSIDEDGWSVLEDAPGVPRARWQRRGGLGRGVRVGLLQAVCTLGADPAVGLSSVELASSVAERAARQGLTPGGRGCAARRRGCPVGHCSGSPAGAAPSPATLALARAILSMC